MGDSPVNRIALLQTVGTGGDNNPVWEGLAFTVQQLKPSLLYQLCSKLTREQTIPRFDASAGTALKGMERRFDVCEDPDKVEDLSLAYGRLIDALRDEHPDLAIEADFTSGTKAMSAALAMAAASRGITRLHYAVGARDSSGRATSTERIVSIAGADLLGDARAIELGRVFDLGQFAAVIAGCDGLLDGGRISDALVRARLESLRFMARAYDAMDRFDWKTAFAILRDYRKHACLASSGWRTETIGAQVPHVKACREATRLTSEFLVDLLANAERCIDRGRFDDAVARLYRLCEAIGQARLYSHRIDNTEHAPRKTLEQLAPKWAETYRNWRRSKGVEFAKLGARDNIDILRECGDPVGEDIHVAYHGTEGSREAGQLQNALERRNRSLLAHGFLPVEREHAEDLAAQMRAHLQHHLETCEEHLADLLKQARFLPCPWTAGPSPAPAAL